LITSNLLSEKDILMKKFILALLFTLLSGIHVAAARHHQQPRHELTATNIQALQNICNNPDAVKTLGTQLEENKEIKNWFAQHKKFLIGAGISTGLLTLVLIGFFLRKRGIVVPSSLPLNAGDGAGNGAGAGMEGFDVEP
jgi:hypothetical protein